MSRLLLLLAALAVAGPVFAAEKLDAVDEALQPGAYEERAAAGTVAQLTVPFLRSPALERLWGPPRLIVVSDGSYVLVYRSPKIKDGVDRYFKIVGTRRPIPVITDNRGRPERDGSTFVLGQRVKYFGMGNETPAWQSDALLLVAPDGRRANYVLIYAGRRPWPGKFFPPVAW